MNKKKIYFYGPNRQVRFGQNDQDSLFYNTVPLFLNSYIKRTRPELHNQIEWSEIIIFEKSTEQLAKELNDLEIDILCVSLYVWNIDMIIENIKNIKQQLKKPVTIVAGGPSVDVFRNKSFLLDKPYIDYAVYTQGEEAFVNILDSIINGKKLNVLNTKNSAWLDENSQLKISSFEFVKLHHGSPYLESKELLLKMHDNIKDMGLIMGFPYETSRGCPYACAFCDWTSGLTHKVSKRDFDYEEELDFFGHHGIVNLQMADANFGMLKRDLDIAKTLVKLKKEKGYQFRIFGSNFNKLKKDIPFEIMDLLIGAEILVSPRFSVQDIDPRVLQDIDRPDIPWEEHKVYIEKIKTKYPKVHVRIELILGLPGQTCESWENTLIELSTYPLLIHALTVIPNSPMGYDSEYKQKMKIKTLWTNTDSTTHTNSERESYNLETVIETYSYSYNDYLYNTLLAKVFAIFEYVPFESRRELINRIKTSRGLFEIKSKLKTHLENATCQQMIKDVKKFIIQLYREYNDWPNELKSYLKEFIINDYADRKRNN